MVKKIKMAYDQIETNKLLLKRYATVKEDDAHGKGQEQKPEQASEERIQHYSDSNSLLMPISGSVCLQPPCTTATSTEKQIISRVRENQTQPANQGT